MRIHRVSSLTYARIAGSVISLDSVATIPVSLLERTVGFLTTNQEAHLARALVLAYDLDIGLLRT